MATSVVDSPDRKRLCQYADGVGAHQAPGAGQRHTGHRTEKSILYWWTSVLLSSGRQQESRVLGF
jgi:hypothetical protein